MNSSDSVEQTVRLTLEGMEVAFKIAGAGAKNIAVMIYTMMKEKEKTKGKTRLTNMLKSGKPLKIFTFNAEDLEVFSREAERYGVLYCALAVKKDSKIDGEVDVLIREEDASKVNRIAERFKFREIGTIKKKLEQERQAEQMAKEELKDETKKLIDDILPEETSQAKEFPSNTNHTEGKNLSEISLDTKICNKTENSKKNEKKSVMEELKEIEKGIKNQEKQEDLETVKETLQTDKQKNKKLSKKKEKHRKQLKQLKERE